MLHDEKLGVHNFVFPDILVCRRCYIRFIRKVNEKKGVEGHEETRKAFDFMLSYVGALSPLSLFKQCIMTSNLNFSKFFYLHFSNR